MLFILFVKIFLVYYLTQISRRCNLIYANIKCTDMLVLVNLCKCYARPLLENCSVIFYPHHVYLINLIENVQKNLPKIAWTAKYVLSGWTKVM